MSRWNVTERYGLLVGAMISMGIVGVVFFLSAARFPATVPMATIILLVVGISYAIGIHRDRRLRHRIQFLLDKTEELGRIRENEANERARETEALQADNHLAKLHLRIVEEQLAFIDVDVSGIVTRASSQAIGLFGSDHASVEGKSLTELLSIDGDMAWQDIVDDPAQMHTGILLIDGGDCRTVRLSAHSLHDGTDPIVAVRIFLSKTGAVAQARREAAALTEALASLSGIAGLLSEDLQPIASTETFVTVTANHPPSELLEHVKRGTCLRTPTGRTLKPYATHLSGGRVLIEVIDITGSLETGARLAAFARSVHAVEVSREGRVIWAAPTFLELVAKSSLDGRDIDSVVPLPEGELSISTRIKEVLAGDATDVVTLFTTINDRQTTLHLTPCRDTTSVLISAEIETLEQRRARRRLPAADAAEALFAIAFTDRWGRVLNANDLLTELLDQPAEKIVGAELSDLIASERPSDVDGGAETVRVERADGSVLRLEHHLSGKNSDVVVHIFIDRTKDWEGLQQSIERAALLDTLAPPVMTVQENGIIRVVSAPLIALFSDWRDAFSSALPDFDPEDIENSSVSDIFGSHEDLTGFLSGTSLHDETYLLSIGGQTFSLRRRKAAPDGSSVIEWRNVTEERIEASIRKAFDNCHAAAVLSNEGIIETATAKYAEILGLSSDEIKGTDLSEIFDPTFVRMDAFGDYWESVVNGTVGSARVERNRKDGKKVYLQSYHTPVFNDEGQVAKVVESLIDITVFQEERREHETQQRALLNEQREVIGSFTDGIRRLSEGDYSVDLGAKLPESYADMREDFARAVSSLADADALRTATKRKQEVVVSRLAQALSDLTEGFLTHRICDTFPDEYEKIRVDFNDAIERLGMIVSLIAATSNEISEGAKLLLSSADELSQRTEGQAANLEQTAKSVDLLASAVSDTADQAGHVSMVADGARERARSSGRVVREAVEAMAEIERSSKAISSILSVIDDIAFQTNLLALNAGVEAARAGDAGRGFAVVAQEVRALAQRSADSAREIKSLIASSANHVEKGVRLVRITGETLDGIVASVEEVSEGVGTIASSAQAQASSLNEINDAVGKIDSVTQQNAIMVEESNRVGHQLAKAALALTEHIKHFSFGEQDPVSGHQPIAGVTPQAEKRNAQVTRAPVYSAPLSDGNAAIDLDWQEF